MRIRLTLPSQTWIQLAETNKKALPAFFIQMTQFVPRYLAFCAFLEVSRLEAFDDPLYMRLREHLIAQFGSL